MDWTIELVVVQVTDIDQAKAYYMDKVGSEELVDVTVGAGMRVVQLTPPGVPVRSRS